MQTDQNFTVFSTRVARGNFRVSFPQDLHVRALDPRERTGSIVGCLVQRQELRTDLERDGVLGLGVLAHDLAGLVLDLPNIRTSQRRSSGVSNKLELCVS